MSAVLRKLWPYDEVTFSKDPSSHNRFLLSTPWLKVALDVPPSDLERAELFLRKLAANALNGNDLENVNWFFASLAKYPFTYLLPEINPSASDRHEVYSQDLNQDTPEKLLGTLTRESADNLSITNVSAHRLPKAWSWDLDAALNFSKHLEGYDPYSLFSVARRFHLLNDLEFNKTAEMLNHVQSLKADQEKFRRASALVIRQNHYITVKCDSVLRGALPIAQNSYDDVLAFIEAEAGHDNILEKAVRSLGENPKDVTVVPVAITLMEVFKYITERNLLAFAMVVDIFERTSYRDEDPVTSMLREGGQAHAGRQIDIHREINDAGGHENVALSFLKNMSGVSESYAREAVRLSELATLVIHQLSAETLEFIKSY